jgi:hypothetical protein
MTAYRTNEEIGVFTTFRAEQGETFFRALAQELDGIREESGLDLVLLEQDAEPFRGCAQCGAPRGGSLSDSDQLGWLKETANRFVTLLRPRLSQLAATAEADDRQ